MGAIQSVISLNQKIENMFTLGIILLILGCVMKIWFRLNHREETRSLAPQNILLRNSAIQMIQEKKRKGMFDANVFLIIGTVLVLITAVFN